MSSAAVVAGAVCLNWRLGHQCGFAGPHLLTTYVFRWGSFVLGTRLALWGCCTSVAGNCSSERRFQRALSFRIVPPSRTFLTSESSAKVIRADTIRRRDRTNDDIPHSTH